MTEDLLRKPKWADYWFDVRRVASIVTVLVRTAVAAWRDRAERHPGGWPISLRVLFEKLGLTYLKVGQYLALRLDLLPAEVRRDLEALFENVQSVPFNQIREQLETELGQPIENNFAEFAGIPVAAASIAQVHLATTITGARVAVKVQRPDIGRLFASDVRLMRRFARIADFLELAGTISLSEAVDQFAVWTSRELDFIQEGTTADRLRAKATANEVIPRIHWALTTGKILTMDYIEGLSVAEITGALERGDPHYVEERLPGLDLDAACRRLAQACLRQMFVDGFFHGDPHPGNMLILADGRIAFVDFGIFGQLTRRQRSLLRSYLANLILGRAEESFRSYSQLFSFAGDSDFRGFRRDITSVLREWYFLASDPNVPPEARLAGKFSDRISAVAREYRVRMNMDLLLFWRMFIVLDAVAARLSSRLDLMEELGRFFRATETSGVFEPAAWLRDWESALKSASAQTGPAEKVAGRLRSGFQALIWTEETEAEEGVRNRGALQLTVLISGLSLAIAVAAFAPAALLPVVLALLAGAAWHQRLRSRNAP